ncbi:MAG: signal peptidase II [Pseudomonadota bacterium]
MNDAVKLPIGASGIRLLWISVLVIAGDQLTKLWIERTMALGDAFAVLPVLDIVRAHNSGAAFSFLATAGGWQRWAFSVLAVGVSIGLIYWLRTIARATHGLLATGLALILGGAIGNVIDRIEHGYVVDFVYAHWGPHYFPAFNVADSAISIGAVLVVLDALREWRREQALKANQGK